MSIDLLESLYNDLYEYAVMPKFSTLLKKAQDSFILSEDKTDTSGFAEWFIFNYRDERTNMRIIDLYKLTQKNQEISEIVEILNAIKNSKRSLYEVRSEHDKAVLKDIFNNDDFIIENTIVAIDQLISGRIVTYEQKNYLVGDIFELEITFKESIIKYILDQYNQYTISQGLMPLDTFLDLNGHIIYKVMDIVATVDAENSFESELMLHQATYAFKCSQDDLYEKLMSIDLPVFSDDDDEPILRVMKDDDIIAEIEITNGQFYVLCNSESHLQQMINQMKLIINEDIVFFKTDIYTLEELL